MTVKGGWVTGFEFERLGWDPSHMLIPEASR
jgi:hypothetical protein